MDAKNYKNRVGKKTQIEEFFNDNILPLFSMLVIYGPILIILCVAAIGLYPLAQETWPNAERYLAKNGFLEYHPDAGRIETGMFTEISRRMNSSALRHDKAMSDLAKAHSRDMLRNNYLGKKSLAGVNNLDWLNCTYSTSMNSEFDMYLPDYYEGDENLAGTIIRNLANQTRVKSESGFYLMPLSDTSFDRVGVGIAYGKSQKCFLDADNKRQICPPGIDGSYTRFFTTILFCG